MSKKPAEPSKQTVTLEANPTLQSVWFDMMAFAIHPSTSVCEFDFFTKPPHRNGVAVEAARLITTEEHVKKMIDLLCTKMDHYPKKPRGRRDRGAKKVDGKKSGD